MKHMIVCGDALPSIKDIDSDSIDAVVTDPPYALVSGSYKGEGKHSSGFMKKKWDSALPSVEVWRECLRVLKPGAFMFCMSAPRQDVLSRMIVNIEDAGFNVAFPSIYHTFASGFPKASNLSKLADKQNGRPNKSNEFQEYLSKAIKRVYGDHYKLAEDLGVSEALIRHWIGKTGDQDEYPTKSMYDRLKEKLQLSNDFDYLIDWAEAEREVTGYGKNYSLNSTSYHPNQSDSLEYEEKRKAVTPEAKALAGFYAGYSPKPCLEVVIVAMKPIEHDTYIAQALDNGHGCVNLDAGRIPYVRSDTPSGGYGGMKIGMGKPSEHQEYTEKGNANTKGRFAPHLLVEDDVLNTGILHKSGLMKQHIEGGQFNVYGKQYPRDVETIGDSGEFSRFFSLDAWFDVNIRERCCLCGYTDERGNYMDEDGRFFCDECLVSGDYLDAGIKELPEDAQKTFPFMIVPKAASAEKCKGCAELEGSVRFNSINKSGCMLLTKDSATQQIRKGNFHPTCKPIKLMSYLLTIATRESDTILDPYAGSGTTLVAAEMLNRNAVGIDILAEHCEIAYARLQEVTAQTQIGCEQSTIQKIGF